MSLLPSPPSILLHSTVISSRIMAKLLCLVAILLVASAMVAEAVPAPAPAPTKSAARVPAPAPSRSVVKKPATFSLKCIIHNLASRVVTLKLVIQGKPAAKAVVAKAVVAKAKQWSAIGPVKVGCKVPVVVLCVTVKNNKGVAVTKSFPVKLAEVLRNIAPNSSKYFTLTVSEVKSYPGAKKLLLVKIGRKELRKIKL